MELVNPDIVTFMRR